MCSQLLLVCRLLEQQIRDLGQQVTVLLNQVQTLQGGRANRPQAASTPSSSTAVITSDDIISERLLSFLDIQVPILRFHIEALGMLVLRSPVYSPIMWFHPGVLYVQGLQQKNMELLTVVRQLGAEKDQERAVLEQDKAKDRETLDEEKKVLYAERAKQQAFSQSCSPCRSLQIAALDPCSNSLLFLLKDLTSICDCRSFLNKLCASGTCSKSSSRTPRQTMAPRMQMLPD